MRETRGNILAARLPVQGECPFRVMHHECCLDVSAAERKARDGDCRCGDERHSSCFYFFVLTNRDNQRAAEARNPDRYHSRPSRIMCLVIDDEDEDVRAIA